ncbi:AraC family transcriptional regulator [Cupriavidus numazuensis]|uniref:AraC family transcriptional regulator n=1 Tax=Cupriavidus numazuensis TaxID=221992 RepID=UPI001FD1DEC2|nr:AraC family transcriptional regulator [Cupriavidus numazuensis]
MLVGNFSGLHAPTMVLFDLKSLLTELESEGVPARQVLAGTGVRLQQFEEPRSLISRHQRIGIYRNAYRLATRPDVGLLAGARQRISGFGIYGYAIASSRTLGAALDICMKYLQHAAGPVLQISSRIEGEVGIFQSHDPWSVGDLLPFVAEFWRSSNNSLLSRALEAPVPSVRMLFPYPAPAHWRAYSKMFGCPVEFGCDVMEWHYDAKARELELPNANPMTALMCQNLCDEMFAGVENESDLIPSIRAFLVNQPGRFENVDGLAERMGVSVRTLYRRLSAEGTSYQAIVDDVRLRLARQYLEHTSMTIEQIAERLGFSDASNFRKAFKRWTGSAPSDQRTEQAV